jgi:hypothetical protein
MPCYVTGSAEGDARMAADDARAEATHVTRMLCEVMATLSEAQIKKLSPDLKKWWKRHGEMDQRRREHAHHHALNSTPDHQFYNDAGKHEYSYVLVSEIKDSAMVSALGEWKYWKPIRVPGIHPKESVILWTDFDRFLKRYYGIKED